MSFVEICVRDSLPVWEDCLNSLFLRRLEQGTLDEACFMGYIVDDSLYLREYAKVFAWGMTKAERISTFASASSHAMTLMAVDLDADGKAKKWMVENSWGASSGYRGHLIMTDEWFDEYMFRLVVDRKYVPAETLRLLEQKPTVLPAWDPLFAGEE